MHHPFGTIRWLLGLTLLGVLGGALSLNAQNQPKKDTKTGAMKLPSGAVIIVVSDASTIDRPEAVYLTPEKYKELNDQIEALKKQAAADKPAIPSSCELVGTLDKRGSQLLLKLKATFRVRTTLPRTTVFLGCQKAQPTDAKRDDGKLPLLLVNEKGLAVQLEEPDDHSIRLDFEIPITPRGTKGNEVGFELALPGAPITTLTFQPPPNVKRLMLSRKEATPVAIPVLPPEVEVRRLDADEFNTGVALGSVSQIIVTWEDAARATTAAARSAETEIVVSISDTDIQSEALLRLKGAAKEWRFLAPFNAEVHVGRPPTMSGDKPIDLPADQVYELVRPEPGKTEWRLRFQEVNTAELLVAIHTRVVRNRAAEPKLKGGIAIGPFAALEAVPYSGTIRVRTPSHIRATPILKGDTQRADAADDPSAEAVYRYRSLPVVGKDQLLTPLELDVRNLAGTIQARVHHTLALGEGGWRLHSDLTITPFRMEVDNLEVEVPVPGVFEASTPKLVEAIVPLRDLSPQRRVIQIKLSTPQRAEFTLVLDGFYPIPANAQDITLTMPRLLQVAERSNQISAEIPEGYDLRAAAYQWEGDKPGLRPRPLSPSTTATAPPMLTTTMERGVATVELGWKPLRTDVQVETNADVFLGDRQARVSQQFRFHFAERTSRRIRFRSASPFSGLTVSPGSIETNAPGDWTVVLPTDPMKEVVLSLGYAITYPATGNEGARVALPMPWPELATAGESRVRFFRDREASLRWQPALDAGPWQTGPIEILATEATLLNLRASGLNPPLSISLTDGDSGVSTMPNVWIDRTLIQAQADETGQRYRVRFHLLKWQARSFDLDLPLGAADVELNLNGVRTDSRETPGEGDIGRMLRIALPLARERMPFLIELKYSLAAGTGEGPSGWMTRWRPPRPRGRVSLNAVRWQVAVPARTTPLSLGDAIFDERWTIRNGFALPVAAYATSDLDQWILNGLEPEGRERTTGWEFTEGSVTAHQNLLEPLRIVAVPRTLWLLAISLLVLAGGLILSRLTKQTVGMLVGLLAIVLIIDLLLWPQPVSRVLSAAQPGLAILGLILGMQRFLQWRYRRRLARMPGFSRVHAESALARSNGKRPAREKSTVDMPTGG